MASSIIMSALVVSYDQAKEVALSIGMKDDKLTHFKCALVASAIAAFVGNPVDILKSRTIMLNKHEYKDE